MNKKTRNIIIIISVIIVLVVSIVSGILLFNNKKPQTVEDYLNTNLELEYQDLKENNKFAYVKFTNNGDMYINNIEIALYPYEESIVLSMIPISLTPGGSFLYPVYCDDGDFGPEHVLAKKPTFLTTVGEDKIDESDYLSEKINKDIVYFDQINVETIKTYDKTSEISENRIDQMAEVKITNDSDAPLVFDIDNMYFIHHVTSAGEYYADLKPKYFEIDGEQVSYSYDITIEPHSELILNCSLDEIKNDPRNFTGEVKRLDIVDNQLFLPYREINNRK